MNLKLFLNIVGTVGLCVMVIGSLYWVWIDWNIGEKVFFTGLILFGAAVILLSALTHEDKK